MVVGLPAAPRVSLSGLHFRRLSWKIIKIQFNSPRQSAKCQGLGEQCPEQSNTTTNMHIASKINTLPLPPTGQMAGLSDHQDSFLGACSLPPSPEPVELLLSVPDHVVVVHTSASNEREIFDTLISSLPLDALQRELDDFSSPAAEVFQPAADHGDQSTQRTPAVSMLEDNPLTNPRPILEQRTVSKCDQPAPAAKRQRVLVVPPVAGTGSTVLPSGVSRIHYGKKVSRVGFRLVNSL